MIKIIYGAKGAGKTKLIIDNANDSVANEKGEIVFISDTDRYMFELHRDIRFVNSKEFDIKTEIGLLGFIRGLIAGNADIGKIYIDGAARMAGLEIAEMQDFYDKLDKYGEKSGVDFILTVSADEVPEYLEKYK